MLYERIYKEICLLAAGVSFSVFIWDIYSKLKSLFLLEKLFLWNILHSVCLLKILSFVSSENYWLTFFC